MSDHRQTFEDFVTAHQRDLVNFHYRFLGDRFAAEDLAQETFLKAYHHWDSVREPDKRKSWLFAIARRVVIDHYRKHKDRRIVFDHELATTVADRMVQEAQPSAAMAPDVVKALDQCIDRLAQEDRAIVRLLYYEGFTYEEIGEMLHLNTNTLKSRLHRARKSLLRFIQRSKSLADLVVEYNHHGSH